MKDIKSLDTIRRFFKDEKRRAKEAKRFREKRYQRKLKRRKERYKKGDAVRDG